MAIPESHMRHHLPVTHLPISAVRLIITLLFITAPRLSAQITWTRTGSPNASTISSLGYDAEGNAYLGTYPIAFFRLDRGGSRWTRLPDVAPIYGHVTMIYGSRGGGLFTACLDGPLNRSFDGGVSWTTTQRYIQQIKGMADDSAGGLLMGSFGGLLRSTDQGMTWTVIDTTHPNGPSSIAVARGVIYALSLGDNPSDRSRLKLSTDDGNRWREATDSLVGAFGEIVTLPDGAVLATSSGKGVYRSTDSARSWTRVLALEGVPISDIAARGNVVLLATEAGARLSTDGGATWRAAGLDVDHPRFAAISQKGELMIGAAPLGTFRAPGPDGPWTLVNEGAGTLGFDRLVAPSNGTLIGLLAGEMLRSTSRGASWDRIRVAGWSPRDLIATGKDGSIYVDARRSGESSGDGARSAGLLRSTDGGASWEGVPHAMAFVSAMQVDANGDLYVGWRDTTSRPRLSRSTDRGATWSSIELDPRLWDITAISLLDPDVVMVAGSAGLLLGYPKSDGGTTPIRESSVSGGIIDIVRTGTGNLMALTATAVLKSTDGGRTWKVPARLPAGFVKVLRAAPDGSLLVAGPIGVYRSVDDGFSWPPANDGLADTSVSDLAIAPDGTLYAALDTGDVFTAAIPSSAPPAMAMPDGASGAEIAPNPATGVVTLSYRAEGSGGATITITDPLGREVMRLTDAGAADGARSVPLDVSALPDGIYFCRIDRKGGSMMMRIAVRR